MSYLIAIMLLLSCCSSPTSEAVDGAAKPDLSGFPALSCDSPSRSWLAIGGVLQPGDCSRLLIWARSDHACFQAQQDSVFAPSDVADPCNRRGADFAVQQTDTMELWTDQGGCHCVDQGGACATVSGPTKIFGYYEPQRLLTCRPSGGAVGAPQLQPALRAMTDAEILAELRR